jgi:hypothetical protein
MAFTVEDAIEKVARVRSPLKKTDGWGLWVAWSWIYEAGRVMMVCGSGETNGA